MALEAAVDDGRVRWSSYLTSDERDPYGRLIDPAEAYQQFMLGLFDILDEAGEGGYNPEACQKLAEARLMFMDEFEARHPGYGKGRAVWR